MKRLVFRDVLIDVTDEKDLTHIESAFHILEACTQNARSPTVWITSASYLEYKHQTVYHSQLVPRRVLLYRP